MHIFMYTECLGLGMQLIHQVRTKLGLTQTNKRHNVILTLLLLILDSNLCLETDCID